MNSNRVMLFLDVFSHEKFKRTYEKKKKKELTGRKKQGQNESRIQHQMEERAS